MSSATSHKRKREEDVVADGDELPRTVYLEGLPYTASEDDIISLCSAAGPVESIRAPRWQDSGRLRGYAHVVFAGKGDAKKAVEELSGKHVGGRYITISAAKPVGAASAAGAGAGSLGPRPTGCTTLFVKGLPYEASEEDVKAVFEPFGAVLSVRISRNTVTKQSKGFGYVQFEHGFSAEKAVKAWSSGISVGGRRVSALDWDTGAPKASYRAADGRFYAKTEEGSAAVKALQSSSGAAGKSSGGGGGGGGGGKHRDAGAAAEGDSGADVSLEALQAKQKAKEERRQQKKSSKGDNPFASSKPALPRHDEEEDEDKDEEGREEEARAKKAKYARRKEKAARAGAREE